MSLAELGPVPRRRRAGDTPGCEATPARPGEQAFFRRGRAEDCGIGQRRAALPLGEGSAATWEGVFPAVDTRPGQVSASLEPLCVRPTST